MLIKDVNIINEAKNEIENATEYYNDRKSGLGYSFKKELRKEIDLIKNFPECGRQLKDGTRRLLMNRFPYLIIYIIHDIQIWIIAIAHQKRRPKYWKKDRGS